MVLKYLLLLLVGLKMVLMEGVIEEVNDRQLEKLIEENDFVAVAWLTKTCKYGYRVNYGNIEVLYKHVRGVGV